VVGVTRPADTAQGRDTLPTQRECRSKNLSNPPECPNLLMSLRAARNLFFRQHHSHPLPRNYGDAYGGVWRCQSFWVWCLCGCSEASNTHLFFKVCGISHRPHARGADPQNRSELPLPIVARNLHLRLHQPDRYPASNRRRRPLKA